jgi:RNA polymerase-binding transcription factor DksA
MDDADITEAQREAVEAMLEQARLNRLSRPVVEGPELCEQCEGEMPELRRRWGARLCVECQSALEKARKHFGRAYG